MARFEIRSSELDAPGERYARRMERLGPYRLLHRLGPRRPVRCLTISAGSSSISLAGKRSVMPTSNGRSVYLIRQDIVHLEGEYLVRAVVIASGPGRAVKDLLRHVRTHHPAAVARRSRLDVVRIGENAPERIDSQVADNAGEEATIVAVVIAEGRHV